MPTLVTGTSVNTWYRLTITVDDAAGFKVEIKQRDTGAGYASYTRAMSASLGRTWRFQHFMYTAGTAAYMDNYVEQTTAATTTAYVGNYYECVPGQACTSYYYFNGQRIAMRQGVPVTYLHGDSLGSASLTTSDATPGVKLSELRYTSFGEVRYQGGQTATDKRFTGQRQEAGVGLYDYGARFFSPLLGRFVSPDSVVPGAADPQNFNRYSYVNNRPLNLIDPTGHCGEQPDGKSPCYDGKTATIPSVVPVTFPTKGPAEMRSRYRGSPTSRKFAVFEFGGYTQTYQKVVAPGTSVDAGIAGGGVEVSTKDTLSCSGKCPAPDHANIAAQPWGKVGVFKVAINSADGSVSLEASLVGEVGNFGFEVNDNHAEIGLGPMVYGVEGQNSIYVAMSESDYYALSANGADPSAIAMRLVSDSGGSVSSPMIYFGAEVGTVGANRFPYAKLPNGGSVLLNYFVMN